MEIFFEMLFMSLRAVGEAFLKCIFIALFSFFILFYSPAFANTAVLQEPLSSLVVDGNTDVVLQQKHQNTVTVETNGQNYQIKNGVLSAVEPKQKHWWDRTVSKKNETKTTAVITVPDLKMLTLRGNASVTGSGLKFSHLTIFDDSSGNIDLKGEIGLDELVVTGRGDVNIQWVSSDLLILNGYGAGTIFLAGTAHQLFANLGNTQKLSAQYLRAPALNIHTQNKAIADVLSTHALNAFAYDQSTIYYFKWPHNDNEITNAQGNVLQGGWYN